MGKMKKGFFISLSAVLVLAIIVTFLQISKSNKAKESQFDAEYLQSKLSADYADDAAHVYLPALLAYSGKYALGACSMEVSDTGLSISDLDSAMTSLMRHGSYGSQTLYPEQTLGPAFTKTLTTMNTGVTIQTLNATVIGMRQTDEWTIEMETEVNITVKSGDITWSNRENYTTLIDVNGLYDPLENSIIQINFYHTNSSRPCYLSTIYSGYSCSGIEGISP
jgi:hypothetical protein